jgi:uncharacterized protein
MGWLSNLFSRKVVQDAPAQPEPTHALDAAGEISYGPGGRVAYDGIVNWMTGQGGANDPATANQWAMAATQNWLALMNIHRSSWIAKKIIDKKPTDMLRSGWDPIWEGSGEKKGGKQTQADQLRQSAIRFGLDAKLLEAMKWARLFGGSVIVIGIKGQLLTDPLPIKNGAVDYSGIKKGGLSFLKVYDRWRAAHDGVIDDKLSAPDGSENPNCGQPEFHVLSSDGSMMGPQVHWSRVIHFYGAVVPWWTWVANARWHDSVLQVLLDLLAQYESMTGAISSLIPKALRTLVMAKGLAKELAEDPASISARYAATERMASMWKVSLYDKDKEEVIQQTFNFAGLDKIWEKSMKEVAGATGYPVSVLFGDEPSGMNATGDASQRNYYDDISAARESELKPAHLALLECIARHEFDELPPGFSLQYRPLWQASDLERSTINLNRANADAIRIKDGVITPELAMRQNKEDNIYSTATQEDVDMVKELAEAAQEAEEEAQNEPAPEVPPKGGKPVEQDPAAAPKAAEKAA